MRETFNLAQNIKDHGRETDRGTNQNFGNDANEPNRHAGMGLYPSDLAQRKLVLDELGHIGGLTGGLSDERRGDTTYGTKTLQRRESERLIEAAKKCGLYVPPKDCARIYGERVQQASGESVVYYNEGAKVYTKIKDPYAKAAIKNTWPEDAIYEHVIHNMLFPGTAYRLVGVTEDIDGVRLILEQNAVVAAKERATSKQAQEYLEKELSLTKDTDDLYMYGNEDLAVTDINAENSDNVLLGDDNRLHFIDPLIRLKRPAKEIIEKYIGEGIGHPLLDR